MKGIFVKFLLRLIGGLEKNYTFALPNKRTSIYYHMYAIVEIAGQQFKVEEKDQIFVHRLTGEPGTKVEFDQVLLVDNKGKVSVGKPLVEGVTVSGQIVEHVRGDKVVIFKKKRRKGYEKESGHRQDFSKILIEAIHAQGTKAKKAKEKEEEVAEA